MRVRLEEFRLLGVERTVSLSPGLNVITGPIASGKTTLIRLIRFLFGGALGNLPPEARQAVTAVSGNVVIRDATYRILRPVVSTPTARVEIAGDDETWRLPATQSQQAGPSYLEWLLDRLDLPRLEVPSAPTKPESEPTPVSVNDYWLYAFIPQEDLGFSVFGHRDAFKNIKRKYVFDVIYGFYDVHTAQLQDELRDVLSRLRHLVSEAELFSSFFEGTELGNRSALEHELEAVRKAIAAVESESVLLAHSTEEPSLTAQLQGQVLDLESQVERLKAAVTAESVGLSNLQALVAQLESQSSKLTRSIVSHKHLGDIDFLVCPRCGSSVDAERAEAHLCYLCLQPPTLDYSRGVLIQEQDAVEAQLVEAQDLFRERDSRLELLRQERHQLETEMRRARTELDFHTRAYVSTHADEIAQLAARRTGLKSREKQLEEYISVLRKLDESQRRRAELAVAKESLELQLQQASRESGEPERRVRRLEERFNEILERFQPPDFGEEKASTIDRNTYMPIYHGRRFDNLSSPGLAALVSVAYALAHHLTAIEFNLPLPSLLVIDGLSEHLGQEGLDPTRLQSVYDFLEETSASTGEDFQIIVVDNEVPSGARQFIRLELSEDERLVPGPSAPEEL